MPTKNMPQVIELDQEAFSSQSYENYPVAAVNDHVIRISIMTEPYHWHVHPDSDESFLVLEGRLCIEFAEGSVELSPGQLLTIPRGTPHCTRPVGTRSVNLTFESANATTVPVERPSRMNKV